MKPLSQNTPLLPLSFPTHSQTLTASRDKTGNWCIILLSLRELLPLLLDSEKVLWTSRGWREADKCQGLIAKLRAEQQGSEETEQRKWHSVAETLSCSDSYHSGHHELMPGCLMQVSGPKEHLSVTSVISVCEGCGATAAHPRQS